MGIKWCLIWPHDCQTHNTLLPKQYNNNRIKQVNYLNPRNACVELNVYFVIPTSSNIVSSPLNTQLWLKPIPLGSYTLVFPKPSVVILAWNCYDYKAIKLWAIPER